MRATHFPRNLERTVEALGGDEHVPSHDLLGLDKGSVHRTGRRHDLSSRLELAAHVQDIVLELLLPGIKGGVHSLHLRGGGLLLPLARLASLKE